MDPTPKGGRGLRAECPTTTIRVPVDLVHTFQALSAHYRLTQTDLAALTLITVYEHLLESPHTRDWTIADRMIDDIQSACPLNWLQQYAEAAMSGRPE